MSALPGAQAGGWRRWGLGLLLLACGRTGPLVPAPPLDLVVSPARLVLPTTPVGVRTSAQVEVLDRGPRAASLGVSIAAPLEVDATHLFVPAGTARVLTVSWRPAVPGRASGTLLVGSVPVEVEGEAVDVPACVPSGVCLAASLDPGTLQCVERPAPEGAACEQRCQLDATCRGGACRGRPRSCDDADACTDDACAEASGCVHTRRACPLSAGPCQVASCDPAAGCGFSPVPDGTLCGPDDCGTQTVRRCQAGQCTTVSAPDAGACLDTWLPATFGFPAVAAGAYDEARRVVVVYEAFSGRTWEWSGAWRVRLPATSPPPGLFALAMAYDPARRRVLLIGLESFLPDQRTSLWEYDGADWRPRAPPAALAWRGGAMASDAARGRVVLTNGPSLSGPVETWEWDGTSWEQRPAPGGPTPGAMAYDAARRRVVLVTDASSVAGAETWEWDGTAWARRTPARSPPPGGVAYDSARSRLVLVGAPPTFGAPSPTWEWDGSDWALREPVASLPGGQGVPLAYDAARGRVLALLQRGATDTATGTWTWDGAAWDQLPAPEARQGLALAAQPTRQRLVLFGGRSTNFRNGTDGVPFDDTWEWDGSWRRATPATSPARRYGHALAAEPSGGRVLLFGGYGLPDLTFGDTWAWDGSAWTELAPAASPGKRRGHAMVLDAARGQLLLFGGFDPDRGFLDDTWAWDGATWRQLHPATSPPRRGYHAMAYDSARQRVVVFGGTPRQDRYLQDTWEWDGVTWTERTPASSPPPRSYAAVGFDEVKGRVVLMGGQLDGAVLANDTWEWDGATWRQRRPAGSPPETAWAAMAYDTLNRRMTLVDQDGTWVRIP